MSVHGARVRTVVRVRASCRPRQERGASAVEYGLLIAGIAAIIAAAVFAFGGGTDGLFHGSCDDIIEAQSIGSCS
ncbi:Flp family type IVb pilin [Nocardioides sp. SYSU D00038]|uniref:Flp family type IVb pilin n=1 Tax=Nocardioides sp. SYSU D00038 TaxID=2812554 RepID=UPI001F082D5B|nr:Flp family type IVb pilin [Nocardioides sp. SYSU D00038]